MRRSGLSCAAPLMCSPRDGILSDFMQLVASERGTYSLLVPTMIEAILDSAERRKYDLTTLQHIVSGRGDGRSLVDQAHEGGAGQHHLQYLRTDGNAGGDLRG